MATAPLDTLELAVNLARTRLNDAIASIGGDVLTDTAAFTLTAINGGWRRLQEAGVSFGITWLKNEAVFTLVSPTGSTDPATQSYINWANYYNGSALLSSPILPQDLISPLVLWERVSSLQGQFFSMDKLDNGLPAIPKAARNQSWEWRQGAIYFPGSVNFTDIRLRYAAYYPDFVAAGTTPFTGQLIPILRALNPLAWFIASEVAAPRGDLDVEYFDKNALLSTKFFFDVESLEGKSITTEAQYGQMATPNTRENGSVNPRMGAQ